MSSSFDALVSHRYANANSPQLMPSWPPRLLRNREYLWNRGDVDFLIRYGNLRQEMETTVSELPSMLDEILDALNRDESITLSHEGEVKGTIVPAGSNGDNTPSRDNRISVKDHPLFGSVTRKADEVDDLMDEIRAPRFDDI